MKKKCDFGCGQEATFKFLNGRQCCSSHVMKCPTQKKILRDKNLGKKLTKEHIQKISKAHTGKKLSEDHKKKIGLTLEGRKHTEDTKRKISNKNSGKKNGMFGVKISEETRQKLSRIRKGVRKTKDHRQKISQSHLGKKHSKETKRKLRLIMIEKIESRRGQINPNYNPKACKVLDDYGKENGYKFQHAENGGEFYIDGLGYWVDGYDKENNIVVEVDESHHFDADGNLKEQDINRQIMIEKYLQCNFIRIKI